MVRVRVSDPNKHYVCRLEKKKIVKLRRQLKPLKQYRVDKVRLSILSVSLGAFYVRFLTAYGEWTRKIHGHELG